MPVLGEKVETWSFSAPTEVRKFDKCKFEILKVGGATIDRATFEPGFKWSTIFKEIRKTDCCQVPHFGYQISGTTVWRMDDGTETTLTPGTLVNLPPGHDGWVVGNEPAVFIDIRGLCKKE